jgi:hypothetical protein
VALAEQFVLLDPKQYDVTRFDCGKLEMNEFLSRYAHKNRTLGLGSTWALPENLPQDEVKKTLIGAYYTLASTTVSREHIPTDKKLPAYPVPVVLLARLAVNGCFQKQGLGEKTLLSALRQCLVSTDRGLPALRVMLDVLDNEALEFYQRFDVFQPVTDAPIMRAFARP